MQAFDVLLLYSATPRIYDQNSVYVFIALSKLNNRQTNYVNKFGDKLNHNEWARAYYRTLFIGDHPVNINFADMIK